MKQFLTIHMNKNKTILFFFTELVNKNDHRRGQFRQKITALVTRQD